MFNQPNITAASTPMFVIEKTKIAKHVLDRKFLLLGYLQLMPYIVNTCPT